MKKKKIIIFGATGSTGIYLTDYVFSNIDRNLYEIVAVGRRKTNYFDRFGIKYYSVDIKKKEDFFVLPTDNIYAVVILSGILPR